MGFAPKSYSSINRKIPTAISLELPGTKLQKYGERNAPWIQNPMDSQNAGCSNMDNFKWRDGSST